MQTENKLLIFCIFVLLLPSLTYAQTFSEETSTVSRIVGESPTEMLMQMQRNGIEGEE